MNSHKTITLPVYAAAGFGGVRAVFFVLMFAYFFKWVSVRLKSLEIKGFKSFADKTIVTFDEGITGIIGPNGCGKSNIIDSIRWVIGEQKISALRSENLEALVFNGSKTRSPSGLAEVSLTFENTRNLLPTEFSTVTITRRFYKNGDSEYRLNDVSCRLKDIHNLFMDTGVSNDSYAIIELGMVDDIIKDKDNSRRRMLEQAAGITIYKTRKKEAKAKLDATDQDLNRIEDLLFEINNQLKTLENQAKKAEKYFEIKKDYRELSVELAKAALEDFNISYKQLTAEQETEQDKKVALEAEIATEEAALEQQKLAFIEKEKALQTQQQQFNELVQNLRTKENEKNLSAQKLQFLKEKESGLSDFLNKASGQTKNLQDSIEYTRLQIAEEQDETEQLQTLIEAAAAEAEAGKSAFEVKKSGITEQRNHYQTLQRKQFEAEKKVAVADTSIQNIQRALHQLSEESGGREQQLKSLEPELEQKQESLKKKQDLLTALQEQQDRTKALIFETQTELETLRTKLAEESRLLDAKQNEYALLKSLIDSMEGYPESIKFLHKNPNWNNKAPVLSDIIYVKEEYRAAVENVLDPYLNYYVVNNLSEGLAAIHLLEENKKGKANFFLLDQFQHQAELLKHPAGTIRATDVIEVEGAYKNLAAYLLGNVFIAEDDTALDMAGDFVLLEKHGKYVKGKYSLTGGSVGLFEGKKIGRAKNLEKLVEQINTQKQVVEQLKSTIKTRQDAVIGYNQQLQESQIRQTEADMNALINQLFSIKNKIENLHHSQDAAAGRKDDLEQRLQIESDAIAETRDLLDALNADLKQTTEALKLSEQDYQQSEQAYNFALAKHNQLNIQFTRQQSKAQALKQELAYKENQLSQLHQQIETNQHQQKTIAAEINEQQAFLTTQQEELLKLMKRKSEEEVLLNEADQAYFSLRNILQQRESDLRLKARSKENSDLLLNSIKDRLNDLKITVAGMKERLLVEFKIDLSEILDEARTTEQPVEELQASADRMKKRLENMGEVNPTAVEAFTEMRKRYEFILEQKNDLVNAKDSLLQTIQEVEATANQQFLETFNKVRENFQQVFKALFTEEDTADMVLENPENLAETGIDIIAKPKGKRPSSITQLSGGEKTLTATALLFAIYLIKPAPFCILDEVDAPLDDANVGKFTQMIQKFSNNSQFIIVTHNKTTMSAVDVIYGVTMQEPGVSKLVPVDFRSLN